MTKKRPQIVVLDGYTLNPGDLSWEPLEVLGEVRVFDRSSDNEIVSRAADAEIILTNKSALSAAVIEQLSVARYIGVMATGYNVVDLEAARRHGLTVTNVPTYSTSSVAQMVFAHLLNLTQRVGHHAEAVRNGRWAETADFCFWDYPLIELEGTTLGIVGLGQIGQATAHLAHAFGMRVIATSRTRKEMPDYIHWSDLDTLFRTADVVTLHCPLTDETRNLVNAERLAMMKPTAFLINTSRGPLVDERALSVALNSGRLAGAGLDVVCVEPPTESNSLFSADNCYVTPHIAWATKASRRRLMGMTVDNIRAFLEGQPKNVVS